MGPAVTFPASECHRRWLVSMYTARRTCVQTTCLGSMHAGIDSVAYPHSTVIRVSDECGARSEESCRKRLRNRLHGRLRFQRFV